MFGRNKLSGPVDYKDAYYVQEVFHTIQGEGPFTGTPAVFVRMARCNLACTFCDTDFESKERQVSVIDLALEIRLLAGAHTRLVVLTGGEPLLQDPRVLIASLVSGGFRFQIETAGTVWPAGLELYPYAEYFTIVCSPKTPTVHKEVVAHCRDWKYIVRATESTVGAIPIVNTQDVAGKTRQLYTPQPGRHDTIWLQPCEEYFMGGIVAKAATERNRYEAVERCMTTGARLSLQTHKILGLP